MATNVAIYLNTIFFKNPFQVHIRPGLVYRFCPVAIQKDKLVPNRLSRALALILMGNEKEGRDELNKLKAEKPNDFIIDEFSKIDRKDFIDKFFF